MRRRTALVVTGMEFVGCSIADNGRPTAVGTASGAAPPPRNPRQDVSYPEVFGRQAMDFWI